MLGKIVFNNLICLIESDYFALVYPKAARAQIRKITILNQDNKPTADLDVLEAFSVVVDYDVVRVLNGTHVGLAVTDSKDNYLFFSSNLDYQKNKSRSRRSGQHKTIYKYQPSGKLNLNQGTYYLRITIGVPDGITYDEVRNIKINLYDHARHTELLRNGSRPGIFIATNKWK